MIRILTRTQPSRCLVYQSLYLSSSPLDSPLDTDTNPVWPRYKHKKDRHAVLDALASTVKPITPPLMFGHGPTDPYFIHKSRVSLLQYAQHWLAGKRAANYIIDRNPDLFPGFRALPEVVPDPDPPPSLEPTLERLQYLVKLGLAEESYALYTLLKTEHSDVSIPACLLDNLLELMTYRCVGGDYNLMRGRNRQKISHTHLSDVPGDNDSTIDSAYFTGSSKKWKKDGPCDQLFQEMKELGVVTADSYNSMLMGKFRYDTLKEFSNLYNEMLEHNLQPSLLVHNSYLRSVIFYSARLDVEQSGRIELVRRTIKRMNTEPVVQPDASTFAALTRFASFSSVIHDGFPTPYQIFREMLSRDIKPNLSHLTALLRCNATYLDDLISHVKKNPDILKFSSEIDEQNFIGCAMQIAIAKEQDHHVEYIAKLNKETFGILDSQDPGVLRYYVNYKFGFWNVLSEPERADEMYKVLREYIQMAGFPCMPEIEHATKFYQIGRCDLFLNIIREAFIAHDDSPKAVIIDLMRMFNSFLSDHILPNSSTNSDLMTETADFVWLLVSRFERSNNMSNVEVFFELCRLALKIFEPLDQIKYKRISRWLSLNERLKRDL